MPYFDFLGVLSPFVLLAVSKSFSTFKLAVVAVLFNVFPGYPRVELGLGVAHPVGFLVFASGFMRDVFDFV
jgi:hypothetical protein